MINRDGAGGIVGKDPSKVVTRAAVQFLIQSSGSYLIGVLIR